MVIVVRSSTALVVGKGHLKAIGHLMRNTFPISYLTTSTFIAQYDGALHQINASIHLPSFESWIESVKG